MYWRLTDSMTTCVAAGQAIFLDIAHDRYFALPEPLNGLFVGWLASDAKDPLPPIAHVAIAQFANLPITWIDDQRPMPVEVGMPAALDAEPLPPVPLNGRDVSCVITAVLRAAFDVRLRPLGLILKQRLSPAGPALSARPRDRTRRLAAFRTVRPFVPVPRVCLHDCLALLDWLGPYREGTQLVLGVSAFPFAAHSWVQAAGRVIDDHPEGVSRFQPILHFG